MGTSRGKIYWLIIAATIVAALFIRWRWICPLRVVSAQMAPTLIAGDFLLGWQSGDWSRGDIIWLNSENPEQHLVRIIGLPGDFVELKDCELTINGQNAITTPSDQNPFLRTERVGSLQWKVACEAPQALTIPAQQVKEGHYLVLPDARYQSYLPSEVQVPAEIVAGRVGLIWFSINAEQRIRWNRLLSLIH